MTIDGETTKEWAEGWYRKYCAINKLELTETHRRLFLSGAAFLYLSMSSPGLVGAPTPDDEEGIDAFLAGLEEFLIAFALEVVAVSGRVQ